MSEREYLRDLTKKYVEYAKSPEIEKRRKLWTVHNSLNFTLPLIYIRAIPFDEFFDKDTLMCRNEYYRSLEYFFKLTDYRLKIPDDYITEPFLTVRAVVKTSKSGVWGIPFALGKKNTKGGAAAFNPSLINEDDIAKLNVASHEIDEEATNRQAERLYDAVGDIIDIDVDRQGTLCSMWQNDISTTLAKIRGLEQIMWDAYDRPQWLHKLLSFMRDKILLNMKQTEQAGDFSLINHQNQAMPYASELEPPSVNKRGISPKELWGYMAAQEFTTFSPDMFDEFMFSYQKPILEKFGLVSYGCCEDLTYKIDVLKTLTNLRRIAVSPFADIKKCAECIGNKYVLSLRPNPSDMVSFGVDSGYVRKYFRNAFDIMDKNNCVFDITLKDVETVSGNPNAIPEWTALVREEINKKYL